MLQGISENIAFNSSIKKSKEKNEKKRIERKCLIKWPGVLLSSKRIEIIGTFLCPQGIIIIFKKIK